MIKSRLQRLSLTLSLSQGYLTVIRMGKILSPSKTGNNAMTGTPAAKIAAETLETRRIGRGPNLRTKNPEKIDPMHRNVAATTDATDAGMPRCSLGKKVTKTSVAIVCAINTATFE